MKDKVLKAFYPIITVVLMVGAVLLSQVGPGLLFNGTLLIIAANITMALTAATNKSPWSALLFVALFITAALVFKSLAATLLVFLLFLPIGLVTGIVLKKKGSLNSSVFISTVAVLLIGICTFCAYVYETDSSFNIPQAVKPVQAQLKESTDEIAKVYCARPEGGKSVYEILTKTTLSDEELADYAKDLSTQAYETTLVGLPIIIGESILLLALVCYYIVKGSQKRLLGGAGTKFTDIRVSRTGAVLMVLCSLVNLFTPMAADGSVTTTLLSSPWFFTLNIFSTLMNSVLAVAGLSIIIHVFKHVNLPKKNRNFFIVFLVVGFLLLGISILSIVGTADSFFDFRRKYEAISK